MEQNLTNSCDVFEYKRAAHITFPIFYMLVFLISLSGNSLVLYITFQQKQKFKSTSLYLANLAISDALFTLALPGRIVYYILEFNWPFGDILCRLTAVLFYSNTYAGIAFMSCISVDRYVAMVHPQSWLGLRRTRTVRCVCVLVWAVVILETSPLLFKNLLMKSQGRLTCMEYFNFDSSQAFPYMILFACVVGYCVPLALILVCYTRINLKLSRTAKTTTMIGRSGRSDRAKSVIFVILFTFVLCFSPYHINLMQFMIRKLLSASSCDDLKSFKMSLQITVSLMNLNCCLDPVIYFFAIKTYKKRVMSFFKTYMSTSAASSKSMQDNSSSNT
ncbi:G-protein coupled receptor 183 [Denticeps clupeoides]|nr:G-protein coupled receptor 183-like [Denticeps clupeoides]